MTETFYILICTLIVFDQSINGLACIIILLDFLFVIAKTVGVELFANRRVFGFVLFDVVE